MSRKLQCLVTHGFYLTHTNIVEYPIRHSTQDVHAIIPTCLYHLFHSRWTKTFNKHQTRGSSVFETILSIWPQKSKLQ